MNDDHQIFGEFWRTVKVLGILAYFIGGTLVALAIVAGVIYLAVR